METQVAQGITEQLTTFCTKVPLTEQAQKAPSAKNPPTVSQDVQEAKYDQLYLHCT